MARKHQTVTVKLAADDNARLNSLAKSLRKPKSSLIRLALTELFQRPDLTNHTSTSAQLNEFCGTVTTAHTDLSSNNRHLEGYGR